MKSYLRSGIGGLVALTLNNNVTVTVTGRPVDAYANFGPGEPLAHFTGFGGDGSATGTFAGIGANIPQPLANAPALGVHGGP